MKQNLLCFMATTLLLMAGCKKDDDTEDASVQIGDQITYQASATGGEPTMVVGYYNEEANLVTVENAPATGWSYSYTVKKSPTYVTFGANGGTGSKVTGRILRNGTEVKTQSSDFSVNFTYP